MGKYTRRMGLEKEGSLQQEIRLCLTIKHLSKSEAASFSGKVESGALSTPDAAERQARFSCHYGEFTGSILCSHGSVVSTSSPSG